MVTLRTHATGSATMTPLPADNDIMSGSEGWDDIKTSKEDRHTECPCCGTKHAHTISRDVSIVIRKERRQRLRVRKGLVDADTL